MRTFSKYIVIGIVNTLSTFFIIMSLTACGVGLYAANASGYIAGMIVSYFLNCTFTFKKKYSFKSIFLFLLVAGICYFANLISVYLSILLELNPYISQALGMCIYTLTGFALNKYFTFK